ncbi:dTDP-4-dehydrorhamnose reductase [Desulfurococcus sp.]|uniref:dTDP-4-dehydrorhamnose reductase n=1 Tax=Desulfurococcus sp. TaxID=51678 RepID=UPI0031630BE9
MKILLTGATGLLGYNLLRLLLETGYEIIATYHNSTLDDFLNDIAWVRVDLEDQEKIMQAVREVAPDVIMHAAAYTDVDGCEVNREKAYRINYLATSAIARIAGKVKAFVVYVSTDYVFDGEKGMYKENDLPNPVNYYGFTKLLGEVAISSILPETSLIVRTSGLYGYSPTGKKNFGIISFEKLLRGEEVYAFYDQILSPTYAYALAMELIKIVEKKITGIIHLAGERLSRYEFARTLAKVLGADDALIKPISVNDVKLIAKRPKDSSLDTAEARVQGFSIPPVVECLTHFTNAYRKEVI